MEPLLIDGDTVLVDHRRSEARQGKVFAVRNMDDLLVKRLERQPDSKWILTSDNKDYDADLRKLFEILAKHRVETGGAETFGQAIADIEAEMVREGVFDDDGD